MLHLVQSTSPPLLTPNSFSSINKNKDSIFTCGFRFLGVNSYQLAFKVSRRNGAAGKDSEFDINPDTAREALRKLDEELQSLSNKPANPPKIRAAELNQESFRMTEGPSEVSGSFLTFFASALLVFTILYNVIFITVIQPSIDGKEEESVSTSNINDIRQGGESAQNLFTSQPLPDGL